MHPKALPVHRPSAAALMPLNSASTAEDTVSSQDSGGEEEGKRKPKTTASPLTRTAPNGGKTKKASGGTGKKAGKTGLFGKNDSSVSLLTRP